MRAVSAAADLQALAAGLDYMQTVQIGITQGRMRTGAYGSTTRRTYGVLGDAVNLSARLMQNAGPGEVLATPGNLVRDGRLLRMGDAGAHPGQGQVGAGRGITAGRPEGPGHAPPAGAGVCPADGGADGPVGPDRIAARTGSRRVRARSSASPPRPAWASRAWPPKRFGLRPPAGSSAIGGECRSYGANTSYLVWQRHLAGLLRHRRLFGARCRCGAARRPNWLRPRSGAAAPPAAAGRGDQPAAARERRHPRPGPQAAEGRPRKLAGRGSGGTSGSRAAAIRIRRLSLDGCALARSAAGDRASHCQPARRHGVGIPAPGRGTSARSGRP